MLLDLGEFQINPHRVPMFAVVIGEFADEGEARAPRERTLRVRTRRANPAALALFRRTRPRHKDARRARRRHPLGLGERRAVGHRGVRECRAVLGDSIRLRSVGLVHPYVVFGNY